MFSFGLFSTHIPYIAFVVFYAYFLLFGIEKASAGELGESRFRSEITVTKYLSGKVLAANDSNDSADNFAIFRNHVFKEAVFRVKIRYPLLNFTPMGEIYCFTHFCRPPPSI